MQWFLSKLHMGLSPDLAILLLRIYPKELKARSGRAICIPMFVEALFAIAKTWRQPKCPSAGEGLVHSYSGILYSSEKEPSTAQAMPEKKLWHVMRSKRSQMQMLTYLLTPFTRNSRTEDRSKLW